MKILFITTHNLATNPRLVKEVKLALQNRYQVEVICFEFNNWSRQINERIKLELTGATLFTIPAGRSAFFNWGFTVFAEKLCRIMGRFVSLPLPALSQAISRRSYLMIKELNKATKPDWVIGHNPGALWPCYKAAKMFNCKAGFDVEDYHPGEGHNRLMQRLTSKLMSKLLPRMDYVSFASPLIMEAVQHITPTTGKKWFLLMNYFPASEFTVPEQMNAGRFKLVWFSQNINAGRGLELVLPYIRQNSEKVELHLFGNMNEAFYNSSLAGIDNVFIHAPLPQHELHAALVTYDAGLALEPAKDKNNELAVSNKILAYLQSGLFVLATNTAAQQLLLQTLPAHGICFDYKTNDAAVQLEKMISEAALIRQQRMMRYQYFTDKNWEQHSSQLLKTWGSAIE